MFRGNDEPTRPPLWQPSNSVLLGGPSRIVENDVELDRINRRRMIRRSLNYVSGSNNQQGGRIRRFGGGAGRAANGGGSIGNRYQF